MILLAALAAIVLAWTVDLRIAVTIVAVAVLCLEAIRLNSG